MTFLEESGSTNEGQFQLDSVWFQTPPSPKHVNDIANEGVSVLAAQFVDFWSRIRLGETTAGLYGSCQLC